MSVQDSAERACAEAKRQLAFGTAPAIVAALASFEQAAALGSGEANAKLAHLTAMGAGVKPDWDKSADLLQRAGELGWAPAVDELRLLSRGKGRTVAEMRAAIDIREWVAPRPTHVVRESPRIRTLPGFMTAGECAWVIERGRARLERAAVYDRKRDAVHVVDERSNSAASFSPADVDFSLVLLQARMAHSIGLPMHWFDAINLLHYAVGERFERHVDYFDPRVPGMAEEIASRGQRVATLLVYLNEDFEGGETEFPRLDYRFKGRTGDALVFASVGPDLAPDPRTLHAGLPPTRGEKWLLSQWVRRRPDG